MNLLSNNTKFMDILVGMKDKEKPFKMPDGENYEIIAVPPATADALVNRVREGRK